MTRAPWPASDRTSFMEHCLPRLAQYPTLARLLIVRMNETAKAYPERYLTHVEPNALDNLLMSLVDSMIALQRLIHEVQEVVQKDAGNVPTSVLLLMSALMPMEVGLANFISVIYRAYGDIHKDYKKS